MMNINVLAGGREIYSDTITDHTGWFQDPYPSVWHFIHIPGESIGEELSITFSSPVNEFSGLVNTISYGRGESLLIDSFRDRMPDFIISFFMIIVGLTFILITRSLMRKINADARILYLGEFAIAVGLWLMSETRIMQMFTGNRFFIGSIGYLCVAFIPIPLLLYIRGMVQKKMKPVYSVMAILFALQLISMVSLQVTGTMVFIQSTRISLAMILFAAVIILGTLLHEINHYQNGQQEDSYTPSSSSSCSGRWRSCSSSCSSSISSPTSSRSGS